MNALIKSINEYIQNTLSKKRYQHVLGVKEEAIRLSAIYQVSQEQAMIASLLHDVAKEIKGEKRIELADRYGLNLEDFEDFPQVVHGFLGAEMAKYEFNIQDEKILNAIRYHTTGRPDMTNLEKIIFISDYIEASRPALEGITLARNCVDHDLDKAIVISLTYTVDYLKQLGKPIHPLTLQTLEYYKED